MSLPSPAAGLVVLVTGASSGIGMELARPLAALGPDIVLAPRRADRLEQLAAGLRTEHGVEALVVPGDLAEAAQRQALIEAVRGSDKVVVGLCNNAGFGSYGRVLDAAPTNEAALVQLNVAAAHELTLAFLPALVQRRAGAILHVASLAAVQPARGARAGAGLPAGAGAAGRGRAPQRRVARRVPAGAREGALRGDQGVRAVVLGAAARRAGRDRRVVHRARPRAGADRVRRGRRHRVRRLARARVRQRGARGGRGRGGARHAARPAVGRARHGDEGARDGRALRAALDPAARRPPRPAQRRQALSLRAARQAAPALASSSAATRSVASFVPPSSRRASWARRKYSGASCSHVAAMPPCVVMFWRLAYSIARPAAERAALAARANSSGLSSQA